ncbi:MAG: hypothetical protein AVDCRST_MAG57-2, partial [uncultured Blastococcus sp.]
VGPPDRPAAARHPVHLRRHQRPPEAAGPGARRPSRGRQDHRDRRQAAPGAAAQGRRAVREAQRRRPGRRRRAARPRPLPAAELAAAGRLHGAHHAGRAPLLGGAGPEGPVREDRALRQERRHARRPAAGRGGHRGQAVAGLPRPPHGQEGSREHREEPAAGPEARRQGAEAGREAAEEV